MRNLEALPRRWRFFAEPFEVLIAVAGLLSGVPVVVGSSRPGSLAVQLTPWMVRVWAVALCVGSAVTLASRWRMARARTDEGLIAASRLEAVAMVLLATTLGVYGVAILAVGLPGLSAGSFTLAWASAFGVRAYIVSWQATALGRLLRAAPDG